MIRIGNYNTLRVKRMSDYGAYLAADDGDEQVLLPMRYVDENVSPGKELDVFVYTDSEDRPVATTERPFAKVGEFAFLQVVDVTRIGAFLDWGLSKNLLVPFSEQKIKMRPGGIYLVYVYLDDATSRVVASAKIEKFLGNVYPEYKRGNKVTALVTEHTPIGYKVIVDNLHRGMIYSNELHKPIEIEQSLTAYVKVVRDDGKIDLTLTMPSTGGRVEKISKKILDLLKEGHMTLTDKSSPEEIERVLQCSKRDFKKTVGALYKAHKIDILPDGIFVLVDNI